jgi:aspartate kinase
MSENISASRTLVIKFGGKTLQDPDRIVSNAKKIAKIALTDRVVVVVSAMGEETSRLISLAHSVTEGKPTPRDTVRVAAFGEMTSATLFASALEAQGCSARAILPTDDAWPVLASEEGESALSLEKVNEDRRITLHDKESFKRISEHILPMLESGITPVICGFLARDPMGKLITLGRGGSDTTAFYLGKLLAADEVIIVTDTEGVLTADPNRVDSPNKISVISTDQLDTMARGGALVLHPHSLEHKTPDMHARIVNFKSDDITDGGTLIEGFLRATLRSTPFQLALISVVGEEAIEDANLISHLAASLARDGISFHGLAVTHNYMGIFVPEDSCQLAYHKIHDQLKAEAAFKSISMRRKIARITISSPKFQDQPGILAHIAKLLADNEINVIDYITLQGDVAVYVDWSDRENTIRLLRRLAVSARLDEVIAGR